MRHSVDSSSISVVEETANGGMIVEFKKGGKYEYSNVPLSVIQDFLNSSSVGRFFNEEIRGNYEEKKL